MSRYYEQYKKYKVQAESIEDFLDKYSKPKAHRDRGEDYVQARIETFTEEFNKNGFCWITRFDSITGKAVAFFGKE